LKRESYPIQRSSLISSSASAVDELILDDGDGFPNGFWGLGGGVHFYWRNDFQLTADFNLEKIKYYLKTESTNTNPLGIAVVANGNTLFDTTIAEVTSQNGKWYEFQFPQYILNSLKFMNGNTFSLIVASLNTAIGFPAAYDDDGLKPGFSHLAYYDPFFQFFSGWTKLTGNAAWLIRAIGNSGGGEQNQAPVAVAQVSPNPAGVNQTVNFNGSGSQDPDGQITNYLWNFGNGQTSTQMNATHSYSQAGQFNYSLTVTDDDGATNQTGGQITISDQPSRWTIEPASGNVSAGGSQNIRVSFNSQGLAEGDYSAQLNITSNGGNMTIPISIFISSTVDVKDSERNIHSYKLEQNYPNPFNPRTKINWSIPVSGFVSLKIYNIEGSEIETLVDEFKSAGNYETIFESNKLKNGSSLPSGVYFYRLTSGNFSESKKFVLIK
jgi:PKD repeat protein